MTMERLPADVMNEMITSLLYHVDADETQEFLGTSSLWRLEVDADCAASRSSIRWSEFSILP